MKIFAIKNKHLENTQNENLAFIDNIQFNAKQLIEKLEKITITLLPHIDREIEDRKYQVRSKKKSFIEAGKELKKLQETYKRLTYLKQKLSTQVDILEIIYELVSNINIGEKTLETIVKDIRKFDRYSLESLEQRLKTYEKLQEKFFQI